MALRSLVVAAASVCVLAAAVHPALPEVKTIYLLSMSSGLDQYLAHELTKVGRFEVVTDPEKADALFTDRLGLAFEERLKELYPPPTPPKPVEAKATKPTPEKKVAQGERPADIFDTGEKPPVRISAFARGRGNVFLVSRKSRAVIWSHYAMPKNASSQSLDNVAKSIVSHLENDLNPKK